VPDVSAYRKNDQKRPDPSADMPKARTTLADRDSDYGHPGVDSNRLFNNLAIISIAKSFVFSMRIGGSP